MDKVFRYRVYEITAVMSVFDGFINEYPEISIDCFTNNNLNSLIYLLSHCHSDHMKGLDSPEFYERLQKDTNIKLYVSEVSKQLLLNDKSYQHLEPYLDILPIKTPTTICVPYTNKKIILTLLPAGHCLGSVMFLLEGYNGNVLYTGDFRLTKTDISKYKLLHSPIGKVKEINSLYIDCTFCMLETMHIPSRQESLRELIALIEPWLEDEHHIVYLSCPAQYGYEYLFVELWKKFKMKIHVNKSKMKKYNQIAEISEAVTCNQIDTRIHACYHFGMNSDSDFVWCEYNNKYLKKNVLKIRLSAMWFSLHISESSIIRKIDSNYYHIYYSQHSSFTEIKDIINYLNPKIISPIAIPSEYSKDKFLKFLSSIRCGNNTETQIKECQNEFLGSLKKSKYIEALQGDILNLKEDVNNQSSLEACDLPSFNNDSSNETFSVSEVNAHKKQKTNDSEICEKEANNPKWVYVISSDSE